MTSVIETFNYKTSVLETLFDDVYLHFQQYFSYIVAVSFIGEENWRIRRKPPACHKSLTNFITYCCTPHNINGDMH